ncbi:unnamed protein product [marine sediment metagenome]|uniref:Uncharacterized protein n=1 Tax=marine sediment metagenome TaxID=412755 RepID=X1MTE4_9ZZZZ
MGKIDREKLKLFFLFLGISIFLIFTLTSNILAADKSPLLRVGIFLNQDEINIGGDGTFKIYNLKSKSLVSEEHNKIIKMLPHNKGIEILGKGVYSGPINIIPVGNTKIMVIINGQKYRYKGNIEIVLDKDYKKLNAINIISY